MTRKRRIYFAPLVCALIILIAGPQSVLARRGSTQTPSAAAGQTNQTIEGLWQGSLDAGAFKLRLVMKFSKTADGKFKGLLDSVDQGVNDIPMETVTFESGALHVEMKSIGATYDGKLSADGAEITGEFTQGTKLPLNLKRLAKLADAQLKRPQTPQKPYPYQEEEVSYQNLQDKVTLAATLTLPKGAGPFPAVILITGSGIQDRDETILGHKPCYRAASGRKRVKEAS